MIKAMMHDAYSYLRQQRFDDTPSGGFCPWVLGFFESSSQNKRLLY